MNRLQTALEALVSPVQEIGHAYVDWFVEKLKPVLPWPVKTPRLDNTRGWIIDTKPLGYLVGHIAAYAVALVILGAVIFILAVLFGVYDAPGFPL